MKNSKMLLGMMEFAMAMDSKMEDFNIVERGNVGKNTNPDPIKFQPEQFHERDGIVNMIKDYNLIKSGQSKKGNIKQARIVSKIESYLESGILKPEHIES